MIGLAYASYTAAQEIRSFAYGAEQANRALSNISPSQAIIAADLDIDRIFRDLDRGEATAASSEDLADSVSRFEDAIQPFKIALTDFANTAGARLLDGVTALVKMGEPLIEAVEDLAARFTDYKKKTDVEKFGEGITPIEWMKQNSDEEDRQRRQAQDALDASRRAHGGGKWRPWE